MSLLVKPHERLPINTMLCDMTAYALLVAKQERKKNSRKTESIRIDTHVNVNTINYSLVQTPMSGLQSPLLGILSNYIHVEPA